MLSAVQLKLIWLLEIAVALKLVGAAGPCVTPVPLREAACGLFEALSLIVNVPVRAPTAVGLKLILIVHVAFAASDVPQLLV